MMNKNTKPNGITVPQIKLPSGGGTVRGADENFHADAFTGSSSFNIPIPIPQGRGLTPSIGIGYSSTSGNGLLGMGFHLSEEAISIKTNRALPLYNEQDRYFLGSSELILRDNSSDIYLERHQTSFEWIQKLSNSWKTIHNDNAVSIYGENDNSIIFDPADRQKIFKWLISSRTDAHGNKIKYNYDKFGGTNSYLTSVEYGNYILNGVEYFAYKIIIDYGQVDFYCATTFIYKDLSASPLLRPDVLLNYRAGFVIKTEYLARNIFIQHNFINDPDIGKDCFTHRTEFVYQDQTGKSDCNSVLKGVIQYSFKKNATDEYIFKSIPAINLEFTRFPEQCDISFTSVRDELGTVINQPLSLADYRREGISGILYRNAESIYYNRPLGNGKFQKSTTAITAPSQFSDPRKPLNLVSLEGNGLLQIEYSNQQISGYFPLNEVTDDTSWLSFVPFSNEFLNNIPYRTEYIDLSGNNRNDQLIITPPKIYYRASLGLNGYSKEVTEIENTNAVEAENFNHLNPFIHYGFADVYGDGMAHRIKIEDQKMTIWPNLGYGKFGAKQEIAIPDFKINEAQINLQSRLIVSDISGSGVADLVLIYKNKIKVFFNRNGKSFSSPVDYNFKGLTWSDFDQIQFTDITGNGNICLVFSKLSPHTFNNTQYDIAHYYYEFNHKENDEHCGKAFLLSTVSNGMGITSQFYYKSSLKDYLVARGTENQWLTKLPFSIQVLDSITVTDFISNTVFKTQYTYRNGYYDTKEHSFVGFGYVEHTDTLSLRKATGEIISDSSLPVLLSKQWFHLGGGTDEVKIKQQFFTGDDKVPDMSFQYKGQGYKHADEALFALAGSELHHEIYDSKDLSCPYSMGSISYEVIEVQAPDAAINTFGVYRVLARETIEVNYEKQKGDPHISHRFVLEIDDYNHPLKTCEIAYPRREPLIPEQGRLYCMANLAVLKNQDVPALPRMIGIGIESKSFEVSGLKNPKDLYFTLDELKVQLTEENAFKNQIAYSATIDTASVQCRLLSWQKQYYWKDEKQEALLDINAEVIPALLLPHHSEQIVFDNNNVDDILKDKKSDIRFDENGYWYKDGYWWSRSAVSHFEKDGFYLPFKTSYDWVDKARYLYTESIIHYDSYAMFPLSSAVRLTDDLWITTSAEMDYRLLSPWRITDVNGNKSEALTDVLGNVVATASYEKSGTNGDAPLASFKIQDVTDLNDILVINPLKYIQQAASFFHYEFPKVDTTGLWTPATTLSLARIVYKTTNKNDVQRSIAYSDGFGRVIESKAFAGKQPLNDAPADDAWLASGRAQYNTKGEVIKSYHGYFSGTFIYQYDWDKKIKDTLPPPTTFEYDAAGRLIQTNTPRGLFSRTQILNAWETLHFDESDTILESTYYREYKNGRLTLSTEEKDALLKSVAFYNTPSAAITDTLGHQIIGVSNNHMNQDLAKGIDWKKTKLTSADIDAQDPNLLVQWQSFDIQGRVLLQADARFNDFNQTAIDADKKYNFKYLYPIATGMAYAWSADAGESCTYSDVAGNTLLSWDAAGNKHGFDYDNLHRPIKQTVQSVGDIKPRGVAITNYGESQADAQEKNLIGKVFQYFDTGGFSRSDRYTWDGHPIQPKFQYRIEYKKEPDFDHVPETFEDEVFTTSSAFDAVGRLLQQTYPDGSIGNWKYGVMGNCISSSITVNGETKEQNIVSDSQLNSFGQLTSVVYGNGIRTSHVYDPLTMQLQKIKSIKDNQELQHQIYWHDATGLITTMQNKLADTVFNNNQKVNPANTYTYDALYRLLSATGRNQIAGNSQPGNLKAVENYTEKYSYDKGNSLLSLQRMSSKAFTRNYTIDAKSNRVSSYQIGNDNINIAYDVLGQMQYINGAGSQKLIWNTQGNIASATIVERSGDMNSNDIEYYVYSAGIRVRKVTERLNNGQITIEDKRYLGAYKCTRKPHTNTRHSIALGGIGKHDCEVQYSTDASQKITKDGVIYRYQHANHLNSIGLETNQHGEIISYEEYSPFGETVYNFSLNNLDSSKEYRYSAQECDNSTGLYYYGYRYYAPWLCRWTRPDPAGTIDGFNLYAFVGNEPIGKVDVMGLVRGKGRGKTSKKKLTGITKSNEKKTLKKKTKASIQKQQYQASGQKKTIRKKRDWSQRGPTLSERAQIRMIGKNEKNEKTIGQLSGHEKLAVQITGKRIIKTDNSDFGSLVDRKLRQYNVSLANIDVTKEKSDLTSLINFDKEFKSKYGEVDGKSGKKITLVYGRIYNPADVQDKRNSIDHVMPLNLDTKIHDRGHLIWQSASKHEKIDTVYNIVAENAKVNQFAKTAWERRVNSLAENNNEVHHLSIVDWDTDNNVTGVYHYSFVNRTYHEGIYFSNPQMSLLTHRA